MKLKNLNFDKSDKPTNWFDDGVLDDDRVRRVIRGRRRNLHLREYNRGEGDWETLCRSIALLKDFYKPQGSQVAFADGVEHAANVCLSLSPPAHPVSERWRELRILKCWAALFMLRLWWRGAPSATSRLRHATKCAKSGMVTNLLRLSSKSRVDVLTI